MFTAWPAGGVAVWCFFSFSCLKMAEVDNDGEHKTSDKDDLQALKVWSPDINAINRLLSFIFKMRKCTLIASLLLEVIMELLLSIPSITITTNTWLTSNTSYYMDVDSDMGCKSDYFVCVMCTYVDSRQQNQQYRSPHVSSGWVKSAL